MTTRNAPDFAAIHDELVTVARDVLAGTDSARGVDWKVLSRVGWPGLEVAAEFGGAGATFAEVALLLQEVGRGAVRTPFPSVAALAIPALQMLAPSAEQQRLLSSAASGERVPVLVLPGEYLWTADESEGGEPESGGMSAPAETDRPMAVHGDAERSGAGAHAPVATAYLNEKPGAGTGFTFAERGSVLVLSGVAELVPDVTEAQVLLVPAYDPSGVLVLAIVDPAAHGVRVTAQPVVDRTRALGAVTLRDVRPEAVCRFRDEMRNPLERLSARAAVAIACDSLGLSEAMLEATVAYTSVREQFGRPVGSFQAVQHACADMLVESTVARRLLAAAIDAQVHDTPDAAVSASMAKAFVTSAAVRIAGRAMQLHGGIGYTWESGIHTYLERAVLNRALFGSPAAHRRRLAARYRRS